MAHNVIALDDQASSNKAQKATADNQGQAKRQSKEDLLATTEGHGLAKYPEGAHGLARSPQVYCVSLGKRSAVLSFNGIVIGGWFAALNKWLLEWTKACRAFSHHRPGPQP